MQFLNTILILNLFLRKSFFYKIFFLFVFVISLGSYAQPFYNQYPPAVNYNQNFSYNHSSPYQYPAHQAYCPSPLERAMFLDSQKPKRTRGTILENKIDKLEEGIEKLNGLISDSKKTYKKSKSAKIKELSEIFDEEKLFDGKQLKTESRKKVAKKLADYIRDGDYDEVIKCEEGSNSSLLFYNSFFESLTFLFIPKAYGGETSVINKTLTKCINAGGKRNKDGECECPEGEKLNGDKTKCIEAKTEKQAEGKETKAPPVQSQKENCLKTGGVWKNDECSNGNKLSISKSNRSTCSGKKKWDYKKKKCIEVKREIAKTQKTTPKKKTTLLAIPSVQSQKENCLKTGGVWKNDECSNGNKLSISKSNRSTCSGKKKWDYKKKKCIEVKREIAKTQKTTPKKKTILLAIPSVQSQKENCLKTGGVWKNDECSNGNKLSISKSNRSTCSGKKKWDYKKKKCIEVKREIAKTQKNPTPRGGISSFNNQPPAPRLQTLNEQGNEAKKGVNMQKVEIEETPKSNENNENATALETEKTKDVEKAPTFDNAIPNSAHPPILRTEPTSSEPTLSKANKLVKEEKPKCKEKPWQNKKKYFEKDDGMGDIVEDKFCKDFSSNVSDCEGYIKELEEFENEQKKSREKLADFKKEKEKKLRREKLKFAKLVASGEEDTKYETEASHCKYCETIVDQESNNANFFASILSTGLGATLSYYGLQEARKAQDSSNRLLIDMGGVPQNNSQYSLAGLSVGFPFIQNGLYGLTNGNSVNGAYSCSHTLPMLY